MSVLSQVYCVFPLLQKTSMRTWLTSFQVYKNAINGNRSKPLDKDLSNLEETGCSSDLVRYILDQEVVHCLKGSDMNTFVDS